jgi:hypothetical protein
MGQLRVAGGRDVMIVGGFYQRLASDLSNGNHARRRCLDSAA